MFVTDSYAERAVTPSVTGHRWKPSCEPPCHDARTDTDQPDVHAEKADERNIEDNTTRTDTGHGIKNDYKPAIGRDRTDRGGYRKTDAEREHR